MKPTDPAVKPSWTASMACCEATKEQFAQTILNTQK